MTDVGIVVRGKFMYRPEASKPVLIRREIFRCVNAEFLAAGIPFGRREVHVNVGGGGAAPSEADARAIVAAAADAATPPRLPQPAG